MDEDVHGLVLAPFREMVEKGKTALSNAKDAGTEPMQKAAEKLVKEGERALKKIEPLCKKHLDEYGPNFTDALKANDEIATFRTELNDALWEFDDFIEADEFDADKFTELQGLSRKAAPRIYDILMRMKLEHPHTEPEPSVASAASAYSRSWSAAGARLTPDLLSAAPGTPHDGEPIDISSYAAPVQDEAPVMGNQAGPDLGLEVQPLQLQRKKAPGPATPEPRSADSVGPDEVPPKPPVNPWEPRLHTVIPPDVRDTAAESEVVLPEAPPQPWPEDVVSPVSPTMGRVPSFPRLARLNEEVERMSRDAEANVRKASVRGSRMSGGPGFLIDAHSPTGGVIMVPEANGFSAGNRPPSVTLTSVERPPDSHFFTGHTRSPNAESPVLGFGSQRHSRASSTNESQTSVFDGRPRDSVASPVTDYRGSSQSHHPEQSPSSASRDSFHSVSEQPSSPAVVMASWSSSAPYPPPYPPSFQPNLPTLPLVPQAPPQAPPPIPVQSQPSHPSGLGPTGIQIDDGLIPVETLSQAGDQGPPPPADCTINLSSSFYQFKGFCDGAKEVIQGGLGVKRIKKPGIGVGNHVVAKCKSCLFELDWKLVEADLNNQDSTNYQTAGVGFRLRFLSKSHLPARHVEDQLYACLFCIQLGRTIEESDATVFFTQKQLFSHIARHPRPLPEVPGLVVIDTPTVPVPAQSSYDLYFCNPPARSMMSGISREVHAMPSAIASETFRASHGILKSPPASSRDPVLQFAAGARIVGIEFPARYNGEWAIGWADNTRAAFPLDHVRLQPPLKSQIRMQPNSNLQAVARWGRKPKDKEKEAADWLKFDRGDVITSISYPYTEHWCWSGYNSKGKWGIFPQAFIEPNTLMETPGADRVSIQSQDSKSGMFSRMSSRKNRQQTSGGSSGDSVSSHPRIF